MGNNQEESLEFLAAVRRQFAYLFEDYGFVVELCTAERHGEFRMVVLRSDKCKMQFYMWQDVPEIALGTLDAVARGSSDNTAWKDINQVLGFLRAENPGLQPDVIKQKSGSTFEESLGWYAARLRPYARLAFAAFSESAPGDWWERFNAFKDSRRKVVVADIESTKTKGPLQKK